MSSPYKIEYLRKICKGEKVTRGQFNIIFNEIMLWLEKLIKCLSYNRGYDFRYLFKNFHDVAIDICGNLFIRNNKNQYNKFIYMYQIIKGNTLNDDEFKKQLKCLVLNSAKQYIYQQIFKKINPEYYRWRRQRDTDDNDFIEYKRKKEQSYYEIQIEKHNFENDIEKNIIYREFINLYKKKLEIFLIKYGRGEHYKKLFLYQLEDIIFYQPLKCSAKYYKAQYGKCLRGKVRDNIFSYIDFKQKKFLKEVYQYYFGINKGKQ